MAWWSMLSFSFSDFIGIAVTYPRTMVTEYLWDHQWMFIRHIPVSTPSGSVRCANRLSCRFVEARYKLNRTTALFSGFYFHPENPFKSLCPVHRLVICARVFSALTTMLFLPYFVLLVLLSRGRQPPLAPKKLSHFNGCVLNRSVR
jgi:hypothetical protein